MIQFNTQICTFTFLIFTNIWFKSDHQEIWITIQDWFLRLNLWFWVIYKPPFFSLIDTWWTLWILIGLAEPSHFFPRCGAFRCYAYGERTAWNWNLDSLERLMRPVGSHISVNTLNMTHILCHEFHTKGSSFIRDLFFCARISLEHNSNPGPWEVCLVSEAWNLMKAARGTIGEKMLRCRFCLLKKTSQLDDSSLVTLNHLIFVCKASKCILLKNHMSSEIKKKLIMMNAFTEEEAPENQAMRMPLYRSDIVWKIINPAQLAFHA